MTLSSVYIIDHFLFENAQVLNFGGHNFYSFSLNKDLKKYMLQSLKINLQKGQKQKLKPVFLCYPKQKKS